MVCMEAAATIAAEQHSISWGGRGGGCWSRVWGIAVFEHLAYLRRSSKMQILTLRSSNRIVVVVFLDNLFCAMVVTFS